MNHLLILLFVPVASFIASYFYPSFAVKFGLVAEPNFRSLHSNVTPRGAGIIAAVIVLLTLAVLGRQHFFSNRVFITLFYGGILVSIVGFLDDRYDLSARLRFVTQIIIAVALCVCFGASPPLKLGFATVSLGWFGAFIAVFALVWFYNLFNFIDGIDGMAISAVIFTSTTMATFFYLHHDVELSLLLLILGCANIGLLIFNWPPARVFLGESGSSFNSFMLSAIILASLWKPTPMLWVWLIVFAYYFTDTTMTTCTRMIKYPKTWYHPHRSHAYQNLARISDNHLKILSLVWAVNLVWLLPLAIAAYCFPQWGGLLCLLAYIPLIIFVYKFGPLYEDK